MGHESDQMTLRIRGDLEKIKEQAKLQKETIQTRNLEQVHGSFLQFDNHAGKLMDRSKHKLSSPTRKIIKENMKNDQLYDARDRWNLPNKKKYVSRNQGTATLTLKGTADRSQTVNAHAQSLMMSPSSQGLKLTEGAHSINANSVNNAKRVALNYSRNTQRAENLESDITKSTHDNTFKHISKGTPHGYLPVGSVNSQFWTQFNINPLSFYFNNLFLI